MTAAHTCPSCSTRLVIGTAPDGSAVLAVGGSDQDNRAHVALNGDGVENLLRSALGMPPASQTTPAIVDPTPLL